MSAATSAANFLVRRDRHHDPRPRLRTCIETRAPRASDAMPDFMSKMPGLEPAVHLRNGMRSIWPTATPYRSARAASPDAPHCRTRRAMIATLRLGESLDSPPIAASRRASSRRTVHRALSVLGDSGRTSALMVSRSQRSSSRQQVSRSRFRFSRASLGVSGEERSRAYNGKPLRIRSVLAIAAVVSLVVTSTSPRRRRCLSQARRTTEPAPQPPPPGTPERRITGGSSAGESADRSDARRADLSGRATSSRLSTPDADSAITSSAPTRLLPKSWPTTGPR